MQALLELVADVRPGLFVFGPDRRALRERRYRKALEAVAGPRHLPRVGSQRRQTRGRDLPHRLSELRAAGGARVLLRRRDARAAPDPTRSDRDLAGYLFFRENVNGWQTEWWLHRDGCRKWFLAERHTGDERGPADVLAG